MADVDQGEIGNLHEIEGIITPQENDDDREVIIGGNGPP